MNDLIAKFRALPMKARVLVAAVAAFSLLVVGDYGLRTRPAALNAGRPVVIQQAPKGAAPGKYAATGDNPQGVTITGSGMNLAGLKLLNVANGTASSDGAAFGQIAAAINASTYKNTVNAVGTSNQASLTGLAQTVDGVALSSAGMRVLLPAQTTTTQDACYVVASGAWTLCPDMAVGTSAEGAVFVAEAGTSNSGVWAIHASGAQVVGTNDLTATKIASNSGGGGSIGGTLGATDNVVPRSDGTGAATLQSSSLVIDDTGRASGITFNDPANPQDPATRAYADLGTFSVRVCSTAALPSYTYSNGTAGVGATVTLSANAVCPTVDGATLSVNDHVLFEHGASFADNGVYVVSALGDGSTTPCVWTRSTRGDTAAKILSTTITVREGNSRGGGIYRYINSPTITMGTTALAWLRVDGLRTDNEVSVFNEDFERYGNVACVTNTFCAGLQFLTTFSGAGAGLGLGTSTATERGIAAPTTGTATTGNFAFTMSPAAPSIVIDTAQYLSLEMRVSGVNTLSDGTDTYRIHMGLGTAAGVTSTAGILADYTQATDTHWLFYARSSSTNSTQIPGITVPASNTTWTRMRFLKYAGESTIHVLQDGVEQGSGITTQQPFGTPLTPLMTIVKSAGTSARIHAYDYYRLTQGFPKGRGA